MTKETVLKELNDAIAHARSAVLKVIAHPSGLGSKIFVARAERALDKISSVASQIECLLNPCDDDE